MVLLREDHESLHRRCGGTWQVARGRSADRGSAWRWPMRVGAPATYSPCLKLLSPRSSTMTASSRRSIADAVKNLELIEVKDSCDFFTTSNGDRLSRPTKPRSSGRHRIFKQACKRSSGLPSRNRSH